MALPFGSRKFWPLGDRLLGIALALGAAALALELGFFTAIWFMLR